jgi:hypothetical protein
VYLPFILFWLLLIWSFVDGDLYPKEAGIFVALWVLLLLGFLFLKIALLWFVVPTVVLDIALILKIFGKDIPLR